MPTRYIPNIGCCSGCDDKFIVIPPPGGSGTGPKIVIPRLLYMEVYGPMETKSLAENGGHFECTAGDVCAETPGTYVLEVVLDSFGQPVMPATWHAEKDCECDYTFPDYPNPDVTVEQHELFQIHLTYDDSGSGLYHFITFQAHLQMDQVQWAGQPYGQYYSNQVWNVNQLLNGGIILKPFLWIAGEHYSSMSEGYCKNYWPQVRLYLL